MKHWFKLFTSFLKGKLVLICSKIEEIPTYSIFYVIPPNSSLQSIKDKPLRKLYGKWGIELKDSSVKSIGIKGTDCRLKNNPFIPYDFEGVDCFYFRKITLRYLFTGKFKERIEIIKFICEDESSRSADPFNPSIKGTLTFKGKKIFYPIRSIQSKSHLLRVLEESFIKLLSEREVEIFKGKIIKIEKENDNQASN